MNNTKRKELNQKKPERKVLNRKIMRNMFKKKMGSNNISEAWEKYQTQKYGEELAKKLRLQTKY